MQKIDISTRFPRRYPCFEVWEHNAAIKTNVRHRYHHEIQDGGLKTSKNRKCFVTLPKIEILTRFQRLHQWFAGGETWAIRWNDVDISNIGKVISTSVSWPPSWISCWHQCRTLAVIALYVPHLRQHGTSHWNRVDISVFGYCYKYFRFMPYALRGASPNLGKGFS
jgi:hypothetical protein